MGETRESLFTERLELAPITLKMVEAVLADRRDDFARLAGARLPEQWPGRALVERAFCASLEAIRANPNKRLWGDRLMITRDGERRVVGSVVFHGFCDEDGVVEVAYGVEAAAQGNGYATEATSAAVNWALQHDPVRTVLATTPPWHRASIRVLHKIGMRPAGMREHELLGELAVFERRRAD